MPFKPSVGWPYSMGLVRITSWYPNFNGSLFDLPPSEIQRMTGLPPKIVWTMTYSHRPHCKHVHLCTLNKMCTLWQENQLGREEEIVYQKSSFKGFYWSKSETKTMYKKSESDISVSYTINRADIRRSCRWYTICSVQYSVPTTTSPFISALLVV